MALTWLDDKTATAIKQDNRTHRQQMGDDFESRAADLISGAGLTIIARNYHAYLGAKKLGEIDIIATDGQIKRGRTVDYLVFVEVRSRKLSSFGDAIDSITRAKQLKIMAAANQFYGAHPEFSAYHCRFDIYAFDVYPDGTVTDAWLKGVFGA